MSAVGLPGRAVLWLSKLFPVHLLLGYLEQRLSKVRSLWILKDKLVVPEVPTTVVAVICRRFPVRAGGGSAGTRVGVRKCWL